MSMVVVFLEVSTVFLEDLNYRISSMPFNPTYGWGLFFVVISLVLTLYIVGWVSEGIQPKPWDHRKTQLFLDAPHPSEID